MTQATLEQILAVIEEDPPVIWQLVGFAPEPPPEEARCLALALRADATWIPVALACIRPLTPQEEADEKDVLYVNWFLMKFLSALAMRFTETMIATLRPLLADDTQRLFALDVLAGICTLTARGQTVPTLSFLLEYEQAAHDWTDDDYQSYVQAYLPNGIDVALKATQELQERLPASQQWKRDCLAGNAAHLRNLKACEDQEPTPEARQKEVDWALDWLERTEVSELIARG